MWLKWCVCFILKKVHFYYLQIKRMCGKILLSFSVYWTSQLNETLFFIFNILSACFFFFDHTSRGLSKNPSKCNQLLCEGFSFVMQMSLVSALLLNHHQSNTMLELFDWKAKSILQVDPQITKHCICTLYYLGQIHEKMNKSKLN